MEFSDGTDARMVKETLDVKTAISNKKTCFTPWVRQLVSVCPRSDFAREFENFETERIAGLGLGSPCSPAPAVLPCACPERVFFTDRWDQTAAHR